MLSKNKKLWTIGVIGLVLVIAIISILFNYQRKHEEPIPEKFSVQLNGDNPLLLEVGTSYVESGVKFYTEDMSEISAAEIEADVKIDSSNLKIDTIGSYDVLYKITFKNGEIKELVRSIVVQDTTAPVITLKGLNPYELKFGEEFVEQGYDVTDNYDEDVKVISDISAVNFEKVGEYTQIYTAVDQSGNEAISKRVIKISEADLITEDVKPSKTPDNKVDTSKPPVVNKAKYSAKLSGDNPQYLALGSKYKENGVILYKNDKIFSTTNVAGVSVKIDSSKVNMNKTGSYTVKYTITFPDKTTTTLQREVIVVDYREKYTVSLNGDNVQYIEVGTKYTEKGVVFYKADKTPIDISLTGATCYINSKNVNTSVIGKYTVEYTVTFADGKISSLTRTVIVKDTTAPVITLNGANPYTLRIGEKFVEQGCKVTDNYDKKLVVKTDVTGINLSKEGEYTELYTVTDSSGNTTTASRKIIIISKSDNDNDDDDDGDGGSGNNPSEPGKPDKPAPPDGGDVEDPDKPEPGKPDQPAPPDGGDVGDPDKPEPGKPDQPAPPDGGDVDDSDKPEPGKPDQPAPPDSGDVGNPDKPEPGKPAQPSPPNSGDVTEPGKPDKPAPPNSGDVGNPDKPEPGKPAQPSPPNSGDVTEPEKPSQSAPPLDSDVNESDKPEPGKPAQPAPPNSGDVTEPEKPEQSSPVQSNIAEVGDTIVQEEKSSQAQTSNKDTENIAVESEPGQLDSIDFNSSSFEE